MRSPPDVCVDLAILDGDDAWFAGSMSGIIRAFGTPILFFVPWMESIVRYRYRKQINGVHSFLYRVIDEAEKVCNTNLISTCLITHVCSLPQASLQYFLIF